MKFKPWKNLRIDSPPQLETTIQEKLEAFGFLGVPAISALLIAHSLGSSNSMYWAIAALGLGFMLALRMMHPKSAAADWKKIFLMNGLPMLVAPALLDLGAEFWAFVVAAVIYFGGEVLLQTNNGESIMKTILVFILLCLSSFSIKPAIAGIFGSAGTGVVGASEYTQLLNNAQLAKAQAEQVLQTIAQAKQLQAQIQDLVRNPMSLLGTDINDMIKGVGKVMAAGQSIGGTMAAIDGNFAKTFKSPLAGSYAENFKVWTETSRDTLGASMKSAGLQRDMFETETAALKALYDKSQSSDGTVAAVQQLSAINANQIQHLQGLKELIATQNVASSTWMAAQDAKGQAKEDSNNKIMYIAPRELPTPPPRSK